MSLQVFDAETGDNVTTAYQTFIGVSNMEFSYNQRYSGSTLVGGKTVGTIEDFVAENSGQLLPPINATTVAAGDYSQSILDGLLAISGGRTKFIFKYTFVS